METAKANNLKPYAYFEHLLTEIPKHQDDRDTSFIKDLLLWSKDLPNKKNTQSNEKTNGVVGTGGLPFTFFEVL